MVKNVEVLQKDFTQVEWEKMLSEINNRGVEFLNDNIYILPETMSEKDILNEFAPDVRKVSTLNKVPCEIVYNKDNYSYLSLRDSDIVLPLIVSVTSGVIVEVLKYYIEKNKNNLNKKSLEVKLITKKEKALNYKKIEIRGDADSVLEALDKFK
ncbi:MULTISPECIES: hypothetical protein [unclassified Clostridium]|uniref:hypothetical protein n=1 Tax=unclassified Clostridium TaxID=2614128 RepID=UPI0013F1370B|nr:MULTISPECIES: hypothetical protein [unclassified Clostridium]NFH89936.1 hypothetical protein [Clostridium botulinum]NFI19530.1 hypothetical protein [Clostridium botulinum]NFL94067.1 hypothetical protein [Clostridium botulinum]NFN50745.1 hypothetical protein [Clostridium botulinum]NFO27028.1 hypothetical protein [Clostridium botulinum]